jgi:hypothetical protein
MATSTLLQIVQDMLSAIEAEGVTTVVSGSTTPDALLCVNIANRTFEELIARAKWKHIKTYKALVAGANLNELKADSTDIYIDGHNVWYGDTDEEARVTYVDPETFVQRTIGRTSADADVTVINNIKVYNDRVPAFYTTFDDETLVFEAMPTGAGLVAGDSKAIVWVEPAGKKSANADVYDLPKQLYPYFRDLCVANATVELGGDEILGERKRRQANIQIGKIATSGNLVDTKDNTWKKIITRSTASSRVRRICIT